MTAVPLHFRCPVCEADTRVMGTIRNLRKRACRINAAHVFYTQELVYEWPEGKAWSTVADLYAKKSSKNL